MKISDPFCRVEKRRDQRYQAVRSALMENGVDTIDAALAARSTFIRNGVMLAIIVLMVAGVLSLLVPKMAFVALTLGVLVLIWLGSVTMSSCSQVQRFIREELSGSRH